jgi:hypothetical protein
VYNKLAVLNKLKQLISDLLKPRLMHKALIGKTVYFNGTRINLAFGI